MWVGCGFGLELPLFWIGSPPSFGLELYTSVLDWTPPPPQFWIGATSVLDWIPPVLDWSSSVLDWSYLWIPQIIIMDWTPQLWIGATSILDWIPKLWIGPPVLDWSQLILCLDPSLDFGLDSPPNFGSDSHQILLLFGLDPRLLDWTHPRLWDWSLFLYWTHPRFLDWNHSLVSFPDGRGSHIYAHARILWSGNQTVCGA